MRQPTESQLQILIVDYLRWHGYTVLETGLYKQSQRAVNTNGTPDLLIRAKSWPMGFYIAVEVKTRTGRLRAEQRALEEAGGSIVCRSLEEVLEVIEKPPAVVGRG
jgi:hypothetical protein